MLSAKHRPSLITVLTYPLPKCSLFLALDVSYRCPRMLTVHALCVSLSSHAFKPGFMLMFTFFICCCVHSQVHDLKENCNLRLFQKGIKPVWEDPANKNGGKWVARGLPREDRKTLWPTLVLAMVQVVPCPCVWFV